MSYSEKEERTYREALQAQLGRQDEFLSRIEIKIDNALDKVKRHDWYFSALWWCFGVIGTITIAVVGWLVPKTFEYSKKIDTIATLLDERNNEIAQQVVRQITNTYNIKN